MKNFREEIHKILRPMTEYSGHWKDTEELLALFEETMLEIIMTPIRDEDGEILEDRIQDAYLRQIMQEKIEEVVK